MRALEFDRVSCRYPEDGFDIIDNLSFSVEAGSFHCIVGASGCGKSTILRLTCGLLRPKAGTIRVNGRPIAEQSHYCGYMPQRDLLFPWRTVGENLALPLEIRGGYTRAERRELAEEALADVGLAGCRDKMPSELSGGMRQRVCIAMTLAADRHLLLADEPGTALDVTIQDQILRLIKKLVEDRKLSVIMVSHSLGVIRQITTSVNIMYAGSIVERGGTQEVFEDPQHPYTRALMECLPKLTGEGIAEGIPGRLPDYANPPQGCRFAPRCPLATECCQTQKPVLTRVRGEHWVACHFADREACHV